MLRQMLGALINYFGALGYPVWTEAGLPEDAALPCVVLRLEGGELTVTGLFAGENRHGAAAGFADSAWGLCAPDGTVLRLGQGLVWLRPVDRCLRRRETRTAGEIRYEVNCYC